MAIIKRNTTYQVKLRASDGKWLTKTFDTKEAAKRYEVQMRQQALDGQYVSTEGRQTTLDAYFESWFQAVEFQASAGWRRTQKQIYRDFVSPFIGQERLESVNPQMIARVLNEMAKAGKAEQTRLHAYALLRKMFNDAIELFEVIGRNPVLKALKPKVPVKEARHLTLDQIRYLLESVKDREYGIAIWLQLYLGLRVGELQALKWEDVDLEEGILRVHRTFVRKENRLRDYPKGRRQTSRRIPVELLEKLREVRPTAPSEFVATKTDNGMLSYEWYHRSLKRYCKALGLPVIGTHSLRHSTSEMYLSHGASPYDIQTLLAHSSLDVTERYVHNRGTSLERITNVIRMFPKCSRK